MRFNFSRARLANAFLAKLKEFGIKPEFRSYSDLYQIRVPGRDATMAKAIYIAS